MDNFRPAPEPDREERARLDLGIEFTQKLGRALHRYGAPAHRLEAVLQTMSREFGLKAEFFSTPSAIFYAYDLPGERGVAHLQRVFGQDLDLDKLSRLDRLFNDVILGKVPVAAASAEVDRIVAAPPTYPAWLAWIAFVLTSFAAARFFDGGLREMELAAAAGGALGLLYLLTLRFDAVGRLFEPLGAMVVSATVYLLAMPLGASPDQALLAGLVVLVPGFSLTIGATELAMKHPVSGVGRLAGAVMTVMFLGVGVLFGRALALALLADGGAGHGALTPVPLPDWTESSALLLAGISLGVLFRAAPRDLAFVAAAVFVPYIGFQLGLDRLGREAAVFLGALAAGLFSNLFARWLNRPSVIVRLPGILILVPGMTSFLSVTSLMSGDALSGVESMFKVASAAIAMVTGFLVSNVALPPRKAL